MGCKAARAFLPRCGACRVFRAVKPPLAFYSGVERVVCTLALVPRRQHRAEHTHVKTSISNQPPCRGPPNIARATSTEVDMTHVCLTAVAAAAKAAVIEKIRMSVLCFMYDIYYS